MSVTHPTGQPQPQSMRPFFIIWTGQALSLLGSQLVQFALVWWLTKTTGSAMMLALASLAAILPQVLIGPFAGVLVDRWHRKTVMLAADSLVAAPPWPWRPCSGSTWLKPGPSTCCFWSGPPGPLFTGRQCRPPPPLWSRRNTWPVSAA